MKHNVIRAALVAALLPLLSMGFVRPAAAGNIPPALESAMLQMVKTGSYHFEWISKDSAMPMTASGDVASLKPMAMRSTTDMGKEGTMEMIMLPTATYMKRGSAAWTKMPSIGSAAASVDVLSMYNRDKANISATDLGMQTRDGQMLHAYQMTNTKDNNVSTIFLDGNGNLARIESAHLVMKMSKFGVPVKIDPPM